MNWSVTLTNKAAKQGRKLPKREQDLLFMLMKDLEVCGPAVPDWRNYSKLGPSLYHCHLSYRWVACWRVENNEVKLIEIYYVGSRENAPY